MIYATIGVLGGMGPLATADFYTKLVRLTPARRDQDHIHVIIDSNPQIPDRTEAFLGRGADPIPSLRATARRLERAGAHLIVIPCNSAHVYLEAIRRSVAIPVLNMMDEVARAAAAIRPPIRAVGLLATRATLSGGLYPRALAPHGITVVDPSPVEVEDVAAVVAAVKSGDLGSSVRARIRKAASALVSRGAQAVVLGCTELPLVMDSTDAAPPVLDCTRCLAEAAIREAMRAEFPAPSRRSRSGTSRTRMSLRRI
jgi:aspartate racemase